MANNRRENAGMHEGHQPQVFKHSQPWQTQGIQGSANERWLHCVVAADGGADCAAEAMSGLQIYQSQVMPESTN